MTSIKIREDRLRRRLAKGGYSLCKTPSRSWLRHEYGAGYMIADHNRYVVAGGYGLNPYSVSLDEAEAFAGKP